MKAVILAAGRGKRLMPYTAEVPKPLVGIQGRPLLDYILHGLRCAGISEIVLVVRHLGNRIVERYGDGSAIDLRVRYAWQEGPEGTGSAVLAASDLVVGQRFMLLWGDVLMDADNYRRISQASSESDCDLLSGLNWLDDLSGGAAVIVEGDRIAAVEEKPERGKATTHWNQSGLFVCGPPVIDALTKCDLSPRGEVEFTSAVQRLISDERDVRWMRIDGFWSDVGTPQASERLNAGPCVAELLGLRCLPEFG